MPEVEREARLAEQTVQDAERHAATYASTSPRRRRGSSSSSVDCVTIDPQVWKTALALAGGDRFRLEVISPTEVRVKNSRG
jgi:hypothetical protein